MRASAAAVVALLGALFVACAVGGHAGEAHVGPVTAMTRAGDAVFSCSQAGVFVRRRAADWLLHAPSFRVLDLAACPPGALLLCGGEPAVSGSLLLLSLDGRPGASAVVATDLVYAVAASPAGDTGAAACADGRVLLFDPATLGQVRTLHEHTAAARDVAFSPDGTLVASCGLDGIVRIAGLGASARRDVLQDHTAGVECLVFSDDSQLLASGARDGRVRIHDASGRLLRTHRRLRDRVLAVAWNARDGVFVAGLADGSVHRLAPGDDGSTIVLPPGGPAVHSLLISGAGRLLAGTREGIVEVVVTR